MSFDWKMYTGNLKWLPERTIYVTRHGSHAYGTNLPTSDMDLRGIFIPPREYYLGFQKSQETEQQAEPDLVLFELRKFMKLAADCNPNAMELLYTDSEDHLVRTDVGTKLLWHRDLFLSTKIKHTFSGYAMSQMKRINIHYKWLKNPPTAPPTRAEFGLPERTVIPADQVAAANAQVRKRLDEWNWHELDSLDDSQKIAVKSEFERLLTEITQTPWQDVAEKKWDSAAKSLGFDTNFIEFLDKERRYNSKMQEWQNYQTWLKTRNEARAGLEAQFGYDTKHGMHLVRLMRMCREILTTGEVHVKRPDAEELLEIRAGSWSYEKLIEWAEQQDEELSALAKTSKLPRSVDREKLDNLCIELFDMTEEENGN